MRNVVVALFGNKKDSAYVMHHLTEMVSRGEIRLTDMCGIVRHRDGAVSLDQMMDRPDRFLAKGIWLGVVAGFLTGIMISGFFQALLIACVGGAVGAGLSVLWAVLSDYGLDDDFVQKVASELPVESSGIVILHAPAFLDPIIHELKSAGGMVLQTGEDSKGKDMLQERLSNAVRRAQGQSPQRHAGTDEFELHSYRGAKA